MKFVSCVVLAIVWLVSSASLSHAVECKNDDVRTDRDIGIYVSEFAVSLGESSCPTDRLNTDTPIIASGARVQFWFRVQGSLAYLRSGLARRPFDIRFFKKENNTRIFFDAIGVAPINPGRVVNEARQNNGRFDWRIFVRKRVFITPGTYVVTVSQGNSEICFISSSGGSDCEQEFKVSK